MQRLEGIPAVFVSGRYPVPFCPYYSNPGHLLLINMRDLNPYWNPYTLN
jgi:hypothetical protein